MSKLSPSQRAKLQTLWRSMTVTMRQTLLAAARAGAKQDEASADLAGILQGLEEGLLPEAGDQAKGFVLSPLQPFTAPKDEQPPSRFRFTPDDLSKMWGWLGQKLAKDTVERARKSRKPKDDPSWHVHRRECADALEAWVQSAERVPKDMTTLMKRFGKNGRDMLYDAISLLRYSEPLEVGISGMPERIYEFDDGLAIRLNKAYEVLTEEHPSAGVWLLLIAMSRMDAPWEVFRVIEKIGRRGDDLVVSKTELAAVGDKVLEDCGFYAARLHMPPSTPDEAQALFATFDRFVNYSVGMTKCFGIRKDGRWGRHLFSLRAEASTNVEKIIDKVSLSLDAGLPEPRRGRTGRIIPAQLPSAAAVDKAEAMLIFLERTREHADAAAIASSQKRTAEAALTRMSEAGELLVDLIADSEGQNKTVAQEGLEITARLMRALGHDEAAGVLSRRGSAAAA